MTPEETPAVAGASTPAKRAPHLWGGLRRPLALYLQFWSAHRWIGCAGCLLPLAIVAGVCGTTLGARGLSLPGAEREPLARLEKVEANLVGSVLNDRADGVEEYIAGMRAFDAQRMWSAYNEQIRAELSSRGQTPETLQRGLTEAQTRGGRVDRAERIGNYPLRDGRRYVFYVITRSGFGPSGGAEEVYFIFTIDPAGKILSVT